MLWILGLTAWYNSSHYSTPDGFADSIMTDIPPEEWRLPDQWLNPACFEDCRSYHRTATTIHHATPATLTRDAGPGAIISQSALKSRTYMRQEDASLSSCHIASKLSELGLTKQRRAPSRRWESR